MITLSSISLKSKCCFLSIECKLNVRKKKKRNSMQLKRTTKAKLCIFIYLVWMHKSLYRIVLFQKSLKTTTTISMMLHQLFECSRFLLYFPKKKKGKKKRNRTTRYEMCIVWNVCCFVCLTFFFSIEICQMIIGI